MSNKYYIDKIKMMVVDEDGDVENDVCIIMREN
jgi:hypothetical protein